MFDFITKLRKTISYKICGWLGVIVTVLILYLEFTSKNAGFGALGIGFVEILICLAYIVIIPICTLIAIIQITKNILTQKTNIIADVGFFIPLIYILYLSYTIFSPQTEYYLTVFDLDYKLYEMRWNCHKNFSESQQVFVDCLAKSLNKTKKVTVDDNVISTNDLIYKIITDDKCNKDINSDLKNDNYRIDIIFKNGKHKSIYLKTTLKYNYDKYDNREYYSILNYQVCDLSKKEKCKKALTLKH